MYVGEVWVGGDVVDGVVDFGGVLFLVVGVGVVRVGLVVIVV